MEWDTPSRSSRGSLRSTRCDNAWRNSSCDSKSPLLSWCRWWSGLEGVGVPTVSNLCEATSKTNWPDAVKEALMGECAWYEAYRGDAADDVPSNDALVVIVDVCKETFAHTHAHTHTHTPGMEACSVYYWVEDSCALLHVVVVFDDLHKED